MIKKFMFAAVAASMVATPVLAAPQQPQRHTVQKTVVKHNGNHKVVVKHQAKPAPVKYKAKWNRGERFDSRYARNYRKIDYRQHRGLKAPPRGYHYVQSGQDVLLVGITSGIIASVLANMIR